MGQLLKELSGQRFGHLLVNRYLFTARNGSKWECLCDCVAPDRTGGTEDTIKKFGEKGKVILV